MRRRFLVVMHLVLAAACGSAQPPAAEPAAEPPAVEEPVEAGDEASSRVDLVLVLDTSGSMNGDRIAAARQAARGAVAQLPEESAVAVVSFDSQAFRTVELTTDRQALYRGVDSLQGRGGTDIRAGLEKARVEVGQSRAEVRHVLLMTDGQSAEEGVVELVREMRGEGVSVSTVALGEDANVELLERIADEGGGRAQVVLDPANLLRAFEREALAVLGREAAADGVAGAGAAQAECHVQCCSAEMRARQREAAAQMGDPSVADECCFCDDDGAEN